MTYFLEHGLCTCFKNRLFIVFFFFLKVFWFIYTRSKTVLFINKTFPFIFMWRMVSHLAMIRHSVRSNVIYGADVDKLKKPNDSHSKWHCLCRLTEAIYPSVMICVHLLFLLMKMPLWWWKGRNEEQELIPRYTISLRAVGRTFDIFLKMKYGQWRHKLAWKPNNTIVH